MTNDHEKMVCQPRACRPHRLCQWPLSAACAQAGVHIEDRGLQLGDAIYEVCQCARRRAAGRGSRISTGWNAPCANSAWPCRWAAPALKLVMREMIARNRIATAFYTQVTRGAVRRDHVPPGRWPAPHPDHDHARRRTWPALAKRDGKGHRGRHPARRALGPLRHQDGAAAAQSSGQAGGAQGRRLRSLAGGRRRLCHRRRLHQCLDRGRARAR